MNKFNYLSLVSIIIADILFIVGIISNLELYIIFGFLCGLTSVFFMSLEWILKKYRSIK